MTGGVQLGPYKLIEKIGAGGMGEVWKAHDTRLNRTVAIKKSAERFSERFEREAQSIAALNDPNICTLYDVGPDYLVMEYVEGHPLKGPLALAEALPLAVQIAAALDAAHSHGIVHRDLKPANIQVQKTGVKLLDFGLARWEETVAVSGEDVATEALTGEGTILGTPQYMSPEQVEGKPADARSDIFAFGCVLYEMLTGVRAFDGASSASLVAAILAKEPRPVREVQPAVPAGVELVLRTCLAKDPAERWQSARDLRQALLAVAPSDVQAVPTPRRAWPARMAWGFAVLALAAAAVLAFVVFRRTAPHPPVARFGITASEGVGTLRQAFVSPDGRQVVISATGADGKSRLWLRALDSEQIRLIPQTEQAAAPFWSPDSKSIAFFSGGFLKRIDLAGGSLHTVCSSEGLGASGAWNKEGTIVFATWQSPIRAVSARGGSPRDVTRFNSGEGYHVYPAFLPDQHHFLYTASYTQGARPKVGSLDGKTNVTLPGEGSPFRFVPPDFLLFGRDGSIMAQRFRPGSFQLAGEPVRIAEPVDSFTSIRLHSPFSASDNGVLVWRTGPSGSQYRLVWRDEAGAEVGSVGAPGLYSNPALSPDGQRLAVDIQEPGSKTRDIWIFDLTRGSRTRFTNHPGEDLNATWSPDGSRIAFTSDRKGTRDLYVKPADGSREEVALVETPGAESAEWWSADGRHLIYNYRGEGPIQSLRMLPMTPGVPPQPLTLVSASHNLNEAQVSPDGKFFAYSAREPGRSVVYVQPFPEGGARWQVSPESGFNPQWRRDGRALYYVSSAGGLSFLMAVDVETTAAGCRLGHPRKLFPFQSLGRRNSYLSGPGNRLLTVEREVTQSSAPVTVLVNWQAALER